VGGRGSILLPDQTHSEREELKDGDGSKNFDLGRAGSIFYFLGQVGLGQPYLAWVWKISTNIF